MHRQTGFQGAFWPFIYASLQFRRPLKNPSSHLAVHLSLTAKDTGYWQFQQPNPAFIQLLTNTFLYSFSLAPNPASLYHHILLLFSVFILHLFSIFILLLSYIVSCILFFRTLSISFFSTPSLQQLIRLLFNTLSCFSPTPYPVSLQHPILLLVNTLSCFSPTCTLSCFSPPNYPA